MASRLELVPFKTQISPSFWHALTQLKLHSLKLSDEAIPIWGAYSPAQAVQDRLKGTTVLLDAPFELDETSFNQKGPPARKDRVVLHGTLKNFNTIEEFKNCDKQALLASAGDELWQRMHASTSKPVTGSDLSPFVMITFADLKKYRYYYWVGFPAFIQKPGWSVTWSVGAGGEGEEADAPESGFTLSGTTQLSIEPEVGAGSVPELAMVDPSSAASPTPAPGWPIRNVLTYLSVVRGIRELNVSLYRGKGTAAVRGVVKLAAGEAVVEGSTSTASTRPGVTGWERDTTGALRARMVDLAPLMDQTLLADQAVDLNLQLMRWRLAPTLDLERVKNTSVLLLGAGTLGCYVARVLLAWGVRRITLVDSGKVSFSNPVRQPLFEFTDSTGGGKDKAAAAAESLKRIYPGCDAQGIKMSIPMPGHPVPPAEKQQVEDDVKRLKELMEEHEVTYLLMDSRESRWLPTLLGAAMNKLVLNVALGFDTYLVMRHGVKGVDGVRALGCYYCNDIVAPMDSLTDRTLDQMCTVTRPGLAAIAGASAVELVVSLLQHPLVGAAPATPSGKGEDSGGDRDETVLGEVPHQLRGFLARFENLKIVGKSYDKCTACSDIIVDAYEKRGNEMLFEAFEDAKSLERATGLDKVAEESEKALLEMEALELDDDEDEGDW